MGTIRSAMGAWFKPDEAGKRRRGYVRVAISAIRLVPHLALLKLGCGDPRLQGDLRHWCRRYFGHELGRENPGVYEFLYLMTMYPEFRNVFYYRVGPMSRPFRFLAPRVASLFLPTYDIGPGLFIQHGFATIVAAKRIGANCWINQQVTIGFDEDNLQPVIEDDVRIHAGAKVIGGVTLGAGSVIGANAVVVKSVPPNCTVVGVPARIVRRNGVRVDETL